MEMGRGKRMQSNEGTELQIYWREAQARCRARKRGQILPRRIYNGESKPDTNPPEIAYVLAITEDEELIWAIANIFKRGIKLDG